MNPIRHLLNGLKREWGKSIRRQLAWSFSLVSLFVFMGSVCFFYAFQRDFLYEQGNKNAFALARTLSFSSVSWVLANDLVGLQEVIQGAEESVDIKFAVVLSPQGEVLASTKPEYIGLFFSDEISRHLLEQQPGPQKLVDESNLVDVAMPIQSGNHLIGWVRVELTRDTANTVLHEIAAGGLGLAIFLMLIITLIATWLAGGLTRGLDRLAGVANDAEHGRSFQRQDINRIDEIGVLARHLYRMLDTINKEQMARSAVEQELRKHKDNLEVEVQQRTEELVHARDAAEAANRVKSDFLANMSHEIRTPMNAILGMLYLAMKSEMSPTLHNYLSKTEGAAKSLLGIINDILDFSKIEAGKLEIESIEFSLDIVLEQLTDAIVFQAEKQGLEFLIHHDVNIPTRLIGDPLRLGQILLNLCGNAVKFTEAGVVELSFIGQNVSETGLTLELCVRDTGIGMTPEVQNSLFQKFTQADQSTTRRFGGTGLGLAISKLLVELMGGRIWVERSQPGQGTTMCCTVPLKISQKDQTQQHELLEKTGPLLKGIRVLLVDDNEISREILADMLHSFQLDVGIAVNGEKSIEQLQAASGKPFDVVLMDWRMPGMNGDEAIRRIRADTSIQPQPKMVMVTAYGREEVMKLADQAEVDGFLIKPVSPSTLLDTILSVLGRGRVFGLGEKDRGEITSAVALNYAGAHLLLVEDNEINREFAVDLLHSMGIEVDEAVNGEEALAMVQQRDYDAVLMDIQMPVMDGMEATRHIRALGKKPGNARFSTLPIIAMTAMAMAKDAEKCQQAGMNDFVTKPVDPDRFKTTLANWLKEKKKNLGEKQATETIPQISQTAEATTPTIPTDLLALKNLNAAQGIHRIGGNPAAYRKQLYRFRKHYSGAIDTLQSLLAEKGMTAGEEYCHALKGVCGNLSANDLFAAVSEMGSLLKQGTMPAPSDFKRLDRMLKQIIDEIDDLPGQAVGFSAGTTILKQDEIMAKLLALASLLKTDLGSADLLLGELRAGVTDTDTKQAIDDIAEKMDVFAIDEACELITLLTRRLSGTP